MGTLNAPNQNEFLATNSSQLNLGKTSAHITRLMLPSSLNDSDVYQHHFGMSAPFQGSDHPLFASEDAYHHVGGHTTLQIDPSCAIPIWSASKGFEPNTQHQYNGSRSPGMLLASGGLNSGPLVSGSALGLQDASTVTDRSHTPGTFNSRYEDFLQHDYAVDFLQIPYSDDYGEVEFDRQDEPEIYQSNIPLQRSHSSKGSCSLFLSDSSMMQYTPYCTSPSSGLQEGSRSSSTTINGYSPYDPWTTGDLNHDSVTKEGALKFTSAPRSMGTDGKNDNSISVST